MAVTKVVAKMYDAGVNMKPRKAASSEKGFEEVIQNAANENGVDKDVGSRKCPCQSHLTPTLVSHKIFPDGVPGDSEPALAPTDGTTEDVIPDVQGSAGYRFSLFIRTTGDISAMGGQLIDKFYEATKGFVGALSASEEHGVTALDSYMQQADSSVSQGESDVQSFLSKMLEAADNGLQAITAQMNSASVMSSLDLSMNSSLPGTNAADIGGIYLQEAMRSLSAAGSSISTGGAHGGLQLIRTEDLIPAPVKLSPEIESQPAVKENILSRFLEMVDSFRLDSGLSSSSDRAKIQFSMSFQGNGANLHKVSQVPQANDASDLDTQSETQLDSQLETQTEEIIT